MKIAFILRNILIAEEGVSSNLRASNIDFRQADKERTLQEKAIESVPSCRAAVPNLRLRSKRKRVWMHPALNL